MTVFDRSDLLVVDSGISSDTFNKLLAPGCKRLTSISE